MRGSSGVSPAKRTDNARRDGREIHRHGEHGRYSRDCERKLHRLDQNRHARPFRQVLDALRRFDQNDRARQDSGKRNYEAKPVQSG
jgi:hypothetical protein